jgi:RNA recognition motif-containing protein
MKLFVGSVSRGVTEKELWNAFEVFGPVESVTIATDRTTGQSKGFAFVEMTKETEAEAAMGALNGTMLGDKPLHIAKARPCEDDGLRRRDDRGGGGGGSRRGGGGGYRR